MLSSPRHQLASSTYCRAKFAVISADRRSISLESNWPKSIDGINLSNPSIIFSKGGVHVKGVEYSILYEPTKEYIEITEEIDRLWAYPENLVSYKKAGFISRMFGKAMIKTIPSSTILVSKQVNQFDETFPGLRILNPQNAIADLLPQYERSGNPNVIGKSHSTISPH
jgi:hypothetical protein